MSCCAVMYTCPDGTKFADRDDYRKYMVAKFGSPVTMVELSCTLWIEEDDRHVYWSAFGGNAPNDGELEAYATGHDPGEVFVESVIETHCDEREMYAESCCRFPVYAEHERTKAYFYKYIDEAVSKMRAGVQQKLDEYVARLKSFKELVASSPSGFKFADGAIRDSEDT